MNSHDPVSTVIYSVLAVLATINLTFLAMELFTALNTRGVQTTVTESEIAESQMIAEISKSLEELRLKTRELMENISLSRDTGGSKFDEMKEKLAEMLRQLDDYDDLLNGTMEPSRNLTDLLEDSENGSGLTPEPPHRKEGTNQLLHVSRNCSMVREGSCFVSSSDLLGSEESGYSTCFRSSDFQTSTGPNGYLAGVYCLVNGRELNDTVSSLLTFEEGMNTWKCTCVGKALDLNHTIFRGFDCQLYGKVCTLRTEITVQH